MAMPVLPEGYRLVALDDVDSTNAHAARLIEQGETGPAWIWALEQTAGRGRRGRDWVSKPGNLYATLLLTLPVAPATAAQLGFVAALAIHDMLAEELDSADDLCLKWPNDVLLDGKKVSGVLSEILAGDENGNLRVALGCGINLTHSPENTRYGAISVKAFGQGRIVSPQAGLAVLAKAFDGWLSKWANGSGFDVVRAAWIKRSFAVGHAMNFDLGAQIIAGRFLGLTSNGALVLELKDGTQKSFHAGEVVNAAMD